MLTNKTKTMTAVAIGIFSGLITILLAYALKLADKKVYYGLILSGIGFLYVGFVWTDSQALIIDSIQAIVFLLLAYYGIKKNIHFLTIGYFLHGCWDITYRLFLNPALIPPDYDLFCMAIDFILGIYLLIFAKQFQGKEVVV